MKVSIRSQPHRHTVNEPLFPLLFYLMLYKVSQKSAMWRNERFSITFLGVFFPTSTLIHYFYDVTWLFLRSFFYFNARTKMCKGVLPWNRGYTGHIIFITNGFLEKSVPNFPGKYSRIFLLQLFYESDHLKYKNINKSYQKWLSYYTKV